MIIDIQEYKTRKQLEQISINVYSFFTSLFDFFLQYFAYPAIAAVATAQRKRIVVA